jgi:hypothetical protein
MLRRFAPDCDSILCDLSQRCHANRITARASWRFASKKSLTLFAHLHEGDACPLRSSPVVEDSVYLSFPVDKFCKNVTKIG